MKMNGKHELVGISILPDAIDPDDADMLCELIRTAVNGALAAAKEDESKTLGRFSGAMGGLL